MTAAPTPDATPPARREVSSNRLFRTTLRWSGLITAALAIVGGIVGYAVAGTSGLWSALVAILVAAVFLGLTAATILIANRWYGDPLYVQLFFAIVLGGWLLKLGIFLVVMILLSAQPWISPLVFFLSIVAGVAMSLVVDVIVLTRMRLPNVSDIELPTTNPEDAADEGDDAGAGR